MWTRSSHSGILHVPFTFAVKLWAAIGILAMLVVPPRTHLVERYRAFLYGALGTALVLWLPVLIPGPGHVFDQVLRFQLTRPSDGTVGAAERLGFILAAPSNLIHSRHIAATLLGCAGLIVVVAWRRRDRLVGAVPAFQMRAVLSAPLVASRGCTVQVTHGLAGTLQPLEAEPEEFRGQVEQFCYDLAAHTAGVLIRDVRHRDLSLPERGHLARHDPKPWQVEQQRRGVTTHGRFPARSTQTSISVGGRGHNRVHSASTRPVSPFTTKSHKCGGLRCGGAAEDHAPGDRFLLRPNVGLENAGRGA